MWLRTCTDSTGSPDSAVDRTIDDDSRARGHHVAADVATDGDGIRTGDNAPGYVPQNRHILPECVQVVVNGLVCADNDLIPATRFGSHGRGWLGERENKRAETEKH